ncbi:ThiF family adenylyltransferase [Flavitalea flava]
MTQKEVFTHLGFITEDNFLRSSKGRLIGLINPGAHLRFQDHKSLHIYAHGTLGFYRIDNIPQKELIRRLFSCKFLLRCREIDIPTITPLLSHHPLSRTISYLMNFVKDFSAFQVLFTRIMQSRVFIVGCGGIGSNVSFLLAGLGCRNFHLLDGDKVERTNLNRQTLYAGPDIHRYKVDVLKKELRERFSDLSIVCTPHFFDLSAFKKRTLPYDQPYDLIIVSGDNPPDLYKSIAANRKKSAVFLGGYQLLDGIVGVFTGEEKGNRDRSSHSHHESYAFPAIDIPPSSGPINFKVAASLTEAVIDYLLHARKKNQIRRIGFLDAAGKY